MPERTKSFTFIKLIFSIIKFCSLWLKNFNKTLLINFSYLIFALELFYFAFLGAILIWGRF
jgi:hypothetical protein